MHNAEPTTPPGQNGWFKSSYSSGACTCVEVRFGGSIVYVRDSKYLLEPRNDPALQPTIAVPADNWSLVLGEVMGDLPPGANGAVNLQTAPDGTVTVTCRSTGVSLSYDADEIVAFQADVMAGEFSPLSTHRH